MLRNLVTPAGVADAPVRATGAAPEVPGLAPFSPFRLFLKDPHTPVETFGFHVREAQSRKRVAEIIEAFFTGYNAVVTGLEPRRVRNACEALPAHLHPFAFEGSGMGYGARGLLDPRARPGGFESWLEAVQPGYRFMYYVGLGVWSGFLGAWHARAVAGRVAGAKYRGLVYDGFGFKSGFFHRVHDAQAHRRLAGVPVSERAEAYRGYGRSLWFVFRDDLEGLIAAVEGLPDEGRAAAKVGVGLAVVFTVPDDLGGALRLLEALPASWQRELERGLRLALHVRYAGQSREVESSLAALPQATAGVLRSHLEQARRAYEASLPNDTFLRDFTRAC